MTTRKEDTAARSLDLAADAVARARAAAAGGDRREADKILVHAYHEGARPTDIVEAWVAAQ